MVKMARRLPFEIVYDPQVKDHLKAIERRHHSLIRRAIAEQLTHEPLTETRNRKPLLRGAEFDADWELRIGPDNRFRVFYTVDPDRGQVQVLAVGVKRGSRLFVGGEEIVL
jgi:mRNA-degrading endonuclease RelE of RelBE toxin-antitoxin system